MNRWTYLLAVCTTRVKPGATPLAGSGPVELPRFALAAAGAAVALLATAGWTSAESASRYGGLGATVATFYAQNPHGAGTPPLGLAYYKVDRTRGGRVIAFHVTIHASPPYSSRERIVLLAGINLPADATETNLNGNTCIVWHSATLKRLIGMAYAAGTTRPGTTTAQMRAERTPRC